ncbi:hypothetical protein JCM8208_007211 [Rhodotorula glutinis]
MQADDLIVIKDEDDDAPSASVQPAASARLASGGQMRRFPPGAALAWTASTRSPLRGLVDRRDEIFAEQREAHMEIILQDESEDSVADLFASQRTRNVKLSYEAWRRFCVLADVPPFPITWALIGLCVFSHCSAVDMCPRDFLCDIKHLRRVTEHLWTSFDYVTVLDGLDEGGKACASFVSERRTVLSTRTLSEGATTAAATSGDEQLEKASKACRNATRSTDDPRKLECPGFPQPHQQFASHDALWTAFLKAIVPVYGITLQQTYTTIDRVHYRCARYGASDKSSRCQFYLVGRRDPDTALWAFDESASTLEHTHGPDGRIIADPTWRPTVTNPVVVRALGLDAPGRSIKRRRASAPTPKHGRKKAKKIRYPTFASPQAHRRIQPKSASPAEDASYDRKKPISTSSSAARASSAHMGGGGARGFGFASSSSSSPEPPAGRLAPDSIKPSAAHAARSAPVASTSSARFSVVIPAARALPPPRAHVTAAALVESYLLELEPSGTLQVLVLPFVERGLTTWRTLSELKDPAAARRLCADIIPSASADVVDALLHFMQLVGR